MLSKKLIRISINTLLIIIGLALIFLINGHSERIIINKQIKDFKERAVYVGEDPFLINVHYYKVPKEYDYEDNSRNTYNMETRTIGSKTDVIITNRNPMRGVAVLDPLVGYLSSNFFVGHSSMNANDDGTIMYEVVGNSSNPENNSVIKSRNDWDIYLKDTQSPIIVGMRIKDTTNEQRDKMVDYASMQVGKGYNYTFIFNRANTFYCTDLVSRSAKYAGLNINYDYFATTGNDMIVSKNTYMFFYRDIEFKDGKNIFNVYYLENE